MKNSKPLAWSFSVIFAFGELYCPAGSFGGEYNITKAVRLSCNFCKAKISLRRSRNITQTRGEEMAQSVLRDKAKDFAKAVVIVCREIKATHKESVLTNQLLRAGTSIGANLHEAQYAQGTKDFISKFEIALKECCETEYWLELLFETGYLTETQYSPLRSDCGAIRRMLISSVNTTKNHNHERILPYEMDDRL